MKIGLLLLFHFSLKPVGEILGCHLEADVGLTSARRRADVDFITYATMKAASAGLRGPTLGQPAG